MKAKYPLTARSRQNINKLDFEEWWHGNPHKRKQERIPVTVCIAAICKNTISPHGGFMVIGAADRMLTGSNIEFEPKWSFKTVHFSTAVTGMFAGDFGLQTEVVLPVLSAVQARIAAEPQNWWSVKEVAELYAEYYRQSHLKRAMNAILAPLGYDINSFHTDQQRMSLELLKQLTTKLMQFESPAIEAIFCGLDLSGAHIYVVDNSADVICHDIVGFAAIGSGRGHANSQFMFANHIPQKSFAETLLLVYSAKKRAEVAPGVGTDTDMFVKGPTRGYDTEAVGEHILDKLRTTYDAAQSEKQKADIKSQDEIGQFVSELLKKQADTVKQDRGDTPPSANPDTPTT